jgi:hypothetical protein
MSFLSLKSMALALAAASLTLPAAALAGVVVAASGPSANSFPAGKKIGDAERIVLRAGDSLTVLDGKGTRVLRGAGTYTLAQQAGPSRRSTFAVLTEQRSAARVRTGAVRGEDTGAVLSPTNLWYVDISKPGKTCLASTDRVRLWRGSAEGDASYTVRGASGGGQTVEFSDGEVLAAWDVVALPVTAGSEYRVTGPDGDGTMSFFVLPAVPEEPEDLAAELIANGCTRQLEILSSAMMVAEG